VKLNAGQYGLYRTNYEPDMWEKLAGAATQLDDESDDAPRLSTDDFAGLLDDTFALAQAGLTPISNFLNMTR
jgi:puromycin-sensitive aminopeptidase